MTGNELETATLSSVDSRAIIDYSAYRPTGLSLESGYR